MGEKVAVGGDKRHSSHNQGVYNSKQNMASRFTTFVCFAMLTAACCIPNLVDAKYDSFRRKLRQIPTFGTCPLPFDYVLDYAASPIGSVSEACPLFGADCVQCGCMLSAVTLGSALNDGYISVEDLADPSAVNGKNNIQHQRLKFEKSIILRRK